MAEYKVLTEQDAENFMTIDGTQTITGAKTFSDLRLTGLSADNNMPYFLGIEAFADGGRVKWVSAADAKVGYATTAGSASASDVSAWAKAASKPSYSYSELSGKPLIPNIIYSTTEPTLETSGNHGDLMFIYDA